MPWSHTPPWSDIHSALGRLVVTAASVEENVRHALLNMLPGQDWRRTEVVIDGYTAGQMRERCERLAHVMLAGDLQADVLAWLRHTSEAQSRRNDVMHGVWSSKVLLADGVEVGPAAITTRVRKPAKGLERTFIPWTTEQIDAVTTECNRVILDGYHVVEELQAFKLEELRTGRDLAPWTRPAPGWTPLPRAPVDHI